MSTWRTETGYKRKSRLNVDGLRNIRANLKTTVDAALISTARKIAADAARLAPKDIEYLAESIYVASAEHSEYEFSRNVAQDKYEQAKAVGQTPKGRYVGSYRFFPESKPTDPREVWVVVGAVHGNSVENGVHTKQPFLTPAVYKNRGTLTNEIREGLDGLSVKAVLSSSKRIEE